MKKKIAKIFSGRDGSSTKLLKRKGGKSDDLEQINTMPSGLSSGLPSPASVKSPASLRAPRTVVLLYNHVLESHKVGGSGLPDKGALTTFWNQIKKGIEHDGADKLRKFVAPYTRSTVLHEVCKSFDPPVEIVERLIFICGGSVAMTKQDHSGYIPLHYAVTKGRLSSAVLQAIIDANPVIAHSYFSMELSGNLATSPLYRAIQLYKDREMLLIIHQQCPRMLYTPTRLTPADEDTKKPKDSSAAVKDTPLNLLWRRYHAQKWECEKFFPGDNSSDEVLHHRNEYRAKASYTRDTIMSMLIMLNFDLDADSPSQSSSHGSHAASLGIVKGKGHIVHACASLACTAPLDLIQLIIVKNPLDISEADSKGKLPLHYAAEARTITDTSPGYQGKFIIETLLELHSLAAEVEDKEGKLPLTLALQAGKTVEGGLIQLYAAFPGAVENAKAHGVDPERIKALLEEVEPDDDGRFNNVSVDDVNNQDEASEAIFVVQRPGVDVHDILGAMWAHQTDAGLQMLAIMALMNMTQDSKHDATAATLAGGISSIVRAMAFHPTEPVVQEKACCALQQLSMATYEPYMEISFAAAGAISAVVHAMEENPSDAMVQAAACGALKWLAADKDTYTQIVAAGGVASIINAMEAHPNDKDVQRAGCYALAHLVVFSTSASPLSTNDHFVSILEKASDSFPSHCQKNAAYVLGRMSV